MRGSVWHTDTLSAFNEELYKGVLTTNNIASNELAKRYSDQEFYGYVLERENQVTKVRDRFFLPTQFLEALPIKVTQKKKFSYKGEVLWFIEKCESRKIPAKKMMEFRPLAEFFCDYKHSNPRHAKLFRMIMIAAYCERINIRIVTDASFGKDSVVDVLQLLSGGVANLYNATLAKLKFALKNHFVVINELGGLKSEEIGGLQTYLTQAGAYKPSYQNNSRGTNGTKEVMSLIDTSHVVFHNTPWYYESKKQKYFEEMFTPAIMDRFPALFMTGYVEEDFSIAPLIEETPAEVKTKIKHAISTINYYKENNISNAKYEVPDEFWGFKGKELQRSLRSFKTISKYLAEYSENETEFIEWCSILKKCREDYLDMVDGNRLIETEERI